MTGVTLARSPMLSNWAWIFTPPNIKTPPLLTKTKTNPSLIFYPSLTQRNRVGLKCSRSKARGMQSHNRKGTKVIILLSSTPVTAPPLPTILPSNPHPTGLEHLQLRPACARGTTSTPLHQSIIRLFGGLGEGRDCLKSQLPLLSSEIHKGFFSPLSRML